MSCHIHQTSIFLTKIVTIFIFKAFNILCQILKRSFVFCLFLYFENNKYKNEVKYDPNQVRTE